MSAVDSMVWSYYENKSIWENSSEENELICKCEVGNLRNKHAVAIKVCCWRVSYSRTSQEIFFCLLIFREAVLVQFIAQ